MDDEIDPDTLDLYNNKFPPNDLMMMLNADPSLILTVMEIIKTDGYEHKEEAIAALKTTINDNDGLKRDILDSLESEMRQTPGTASMIETNYIELCGIFPKICAPSLQENYSSEFSPKRQLIEDLLEKRADKLSKGRERGEESKEGGEKRNKKKHRKKSTKKKRRKKSTKKKHRKKSTKKK